MIQVNKKVTRFALISLLAISIVRYFVELGSEMSVHSLNITIYSCFFAFILLLIAREDQIELKNNYLRISVIFSVGFIIVHFFSYWSYCLGIIPYPVSTGAYSKYIVNESAILSLCCFLCFAIGYQSYKYLNGHSVKKSIFQISCKRRILEYAFIVSVIAFYLFTDKRYFQTGGNYEITNGEGLSLLSSLSQFFVLSSQVACGIQRIYNLNKCSFIRYMLSFSFVYYSAIVIYSILIIMSGDRGPLIYLTFGYMAPYFILNAKKFNLKYFCSAIVIGAIFMTFLGFLRNLDGDITSSKISEANSNLDENLQGEGAWLFGPTMALSNVVRANNVVYEFTNDTDVAYGLGYIDGFLGFIPGLRSYVVYPLLGIDNNDLVNTAHLSTVLLHENHGMGTSPVADTYFNFGFWGCLAVFFLFGRISRRMDIFIHKKEGHLFFYSASFWFLIYSIYIGRSTFFAPITLSIYTWLTMRVALFFTNKKINMH